MPILEAMASSCPVITSNIAPLVEISGDAAIHINPEDDNELSENILLVSSNKDKREEMITKGFQRAKSFTWDKSAKLTFDIYLRCID